MGKGEDKDKGLLVTSLLDAQTMKAPYTQFLPTQTNSLSVVDKKKVRNTTRIHKALLMYQ